MAIETIEMATVTVNDQDAALDFYVNKAGFEKRIDNAFGPMRFLVVAPKGSRTGIVLQSAQANRKPTGGSTGIVLGSSDVEGTYQEMSGRGVIFTQAPVKQPWGAMEAVFSDPDGNTYSLTSQWGGKRIRNERDLSNAMGGCHLNRKTGHPWHSCMDI
ncbi:MAG TPA: VOC family protein [Ktedonobacteraceae bacterium]|nr:VOC family protein [Ktedonobacteraceae bacterium]